jgi:hypothetical protein
MSNPTSAATGNIGEGLTDLLIGITEPHQTKFITIEQIGMIYNLLVLGGRAWLRWLDMTAQEREKSSIQSKQRNVWFD